MQGCRDDPTDRDVRKVLNETSKLCERGGQGWGVAWKSKVSKGLLRLVRLLIARSSVAKGPVKAPAPLGHINCSQTTTGLDPRLTEVDPYLRRDPEAHR